MDREVKKLSSTFNSPLEVGLRILFIFSRTAIPLDLQRLVHYNYLLIHSADTPDGPASIHPGLPLRSCEMLVNRTILKKGLNILLMKGLILVTYSEKGIVYSKNIATDEFLSYFQSEYSKQLYERAEWLCSTFDKLTDGQVADLIENSLGKWGSEVTPAHDEVEDIV
jgi:hypothetical protein